MSYSLPVVLDFGPFVPVSVSAQLRDMSGTNEGPAYTGPFVADGNARVYGHPSVPNGFEGYIKATGTDAGAEIVDIFVPVDPSAYERIDVAVSSRSSHNAAAVRMEMDSNSTQLANIVEDTNELQTDDIPAALAALEAHGDAEWATAEGFSTHTASDVANAITASNATIAITSPFNPVTNSLDIIIGETLDFTITRAFSASWSHIEFVIKDRIDSAVGDDDAILKGIVYADATPGGLIVLNKQAVVGGTSSVVITADQPNNTTRIKVLDGITYQLTKAAKLYFTVRWVDSSSDSQSVNGQAQAGYVAAEGGDS